MVTKTRQGKELIVKREETMPVLGEEIEREGHSKAAEADQRTRGDILFRKYEKQLCARHSPIGMRFRGFAQTVQAKILTAAGGWHTAPGSLEDMHSWEGEKFRKVTHLTRRRPTEDHARHMRRAAEKAQKQWESTTRCVV